MKQILTVLLFLIGIVSCFSQSKSTIKIGILSEKKVEDQQALKQKLQKEIRAVVGNNTTVVFEPTLYNNGDTSKAKSNYNKFINDGVDIVLSFGVVNHFMLDEKDSFQKPTIIVGSVKADFGKKINEGTTSGITNLTYLITPISYKKDLDTFSSIYEYENIGIVVDDYLIQVLNLKNTFDNYFSNKKAKYTLIGATEVKNAINQLNNIDAVYLAEGYQASTNDFLKLVNAINSKKLPSFSSFRRADVEKGILATNQPETNIDQYFRRIALSIESIMNGQNAKNLPVFITYDQELTINYNTAKKIGFPLRYSMMGKANFIGGINEKTTDKVYSIIDIMKGVVADNLSLNAQEKSIDLSNQDLKTAKSNYLPNVAAAVSSTYTDPKVALPPFNNPEFSTAGAVTLQQTLLNESANANISISKSNLKAQQESYNATELDAILDASLVYFDALVAKTNANIQNQNLQLTKKNLQIAKQNFEAGASGKSDVLRFRSELAQNTQSLVEATNNLQQRFYAINQLMNQPIDALIDVEDVFLETGIFKNYNYTELKEILDNPKLRPSFTKFLIEEAKKNAPELKNIGYNLEANERNYRLNNTGRFIPTVALQGQYSLILTQSGEGAPSGGVPDPQGTYNFGLNLSLPIFQQNQRNINKQTALIQKDQLNLNKENIELNLDKSVNDLVLNLVNQIANIEISKIAEETAKESLELSQNAYTKGAIPLIQLIDAQNNYLQSQLSNATANYNYLLTSMQLERSIGYFFLMNTEERNKDFTQRATQYILNKN